MASISLSVRPGGKGEGCQEGRVVHLNIDFGRKEGREGSSHVVQLNTQKKKQRARKTGSHIVHPQRRENEGRGDLKPHRPPQHPKAKTRARET
jgi:hypothetical protein